MNEYYYYNDDFEENSEEIEERNRVTKIKEEIEIKIKETKKVSELKSILTEYQDDQPVTSYILSILQGQGIKKTIRQEEPMIFKMLKNRNDLNQLLEIINIFDHKLDTKSIENRIIKNIIEPKELILNKRKSYYIGRIFNQAKRSVDSNFHKLPSELIEHIFSFWNKNKDQSKENTKSFNTGFNFNNFTK